MAMNDVINLDFVFQFAGDVPPIHVNPASNVVQTGDALQIALLMTLALVAVFSGIFLYLKKPVTVVGKHCALTKSKIAPRGGQNAVLKFALIASQYRVGFSFYGKALNAVSSRFSGRV